MNIKVKTYQEEISSLSHVSKIYEYKDEELNIFSVCDMRVKKGVDALSGLDIFIDNFLTGIKNKSALINVIEKSFKDALFSLNSYLEVKESIDDVDFETTCLVIYKNAIYFVKVGDGKICLIRDNKVSIISEALDESEVFGMVASGIVTEGDSLMILTGNSWSVLQREESSSIENLNMLNDEEIDRIFMRFPESYGKISFLKISFEDNLSSDFNSGMSDNTENGYSQDKVFSNGLNAITGIISNLKLGEKKKHISEFAFKGLYKAKLDSIKIKKLPSLKRDSFSWIKNIKNNRLFFLARSEVKVLLNVLQDIFSRFEIKEKIKANIVSFILFSLPIILLSFYFLFSSVKVYEHKVATTSSNELNAKNLVANLTISNIDSTYSEIYKMYNSYRTDKVIYNAYSSISEKYFAYHRIDVLNLQTVANLSSYGVSNATAIDNNLVTTSSGIFDLSSMSFINNKYNSSTCIYYSNSLKAYILYDSNYGAISYQNGQFNQIPGSNSLPSISGCFTFHSNLYFLDAQDSVLYRSFYVNGGFSLPESYMTNIGVVNSSAVDGNIYFASPENGFTEYFASQKVNYTIDNISLINIPLTSTTAIYTNESIGYIFLLDPQNNRIIALRKVAQGEFSFVADMTNDSFSNIKSIYVDNSLKYIYILDGLNVYKAPLAFLSAN